MLDKAIILGVDITNEVRERVLKYILRGLKDRGVRFVIVTPNPEIITYAQAHPKYKKLLNEAEIAIADGVGVLVAGKLLGTPLKSRFTGVDLIEKLCAECRENPLSMGFLGGRGKVAEQTAKCLQKKHPWIKVSFVGEEWPGDGENEKLKTEYETRERNSLTSNTNVSEHIDILFVAFGFPKQEEWIFENLDRLPVTAAMGVGGAFDFISGKVVRAPRIIRQLGLEWLFRLAIQPWRIKRQLALVKFGFLVLQEMLRKKTRKNEHKKST